jgi:hypothetical protein
MVNDVSVCAPAGTAAVSSPIIIATENAPPMVRSNFMFSPFFHYSLKDDDAANIPYRQSLAQHPVQGTK